MKIITDMKCNYFIALLFTICSCFTANAKNEITEESKTYEKTFSVNESTHINLRNRRGNINVVYREGSEAKIEVKLTVRATVSSEIQKVFDHFQLDVKNSGNNIDIRSNDHIESWTQINTFFRSSNKIKFEDRIIAEDIDEIDVDMVLYIPKISKLSVDNKYNDILFTDLHCDLDVSLYSGKLKGKNIDGDLNMELKYGSVDIGSFINGDIDIYDSKYKSDNAQSVEFKSKYSDISCGDFKSLRFFSHDDEVILGSIEEELIVEAKYSNLRLESFGTAEIDGHDTDIKAKNGGSLDLRSKYGSFDFGDIQDATLRLHDDNFEVASLKDLTIKNSKYSEIYIDYFSGAMLISSSHDDDIYVLHPVNDFKSIDVDLKYSTFKFPISSKKGFYMTADTKYGSLDLGRDFDHDRTHKDDDKSELNINGKASKTKKGDPKITINAYDSKIDLS